MHRSCTAVLFFLATAPAGLAQQAPRYYVQTRPELAVPHEQLVSEVKAIAVPVPDQGDPRTGILTDIDFPQFGVSAVAIRLTAAQLSRLDQARYLIREDVALIPTGVPAGPAWPLNQFCLPDDPAACDTAAPVVYILDTGIDAFHPELFNSVALSFLPGLSYGYNLAITPPVLLDPYHDSYDHGTRMAGCLGGQTTGFLKAPGSAAMVKSVVIYDAPVPGPVSTFVSQAISGILGAVTDHQTRKSLPYLKNHTSVLLFAHSTTLASGRFGDLDRAMEIAWEEGVHVVMSAGNEGAPAVRVSPAGAAWGYESGGIQTRYWFGAPPQGATFYRGVDAFLVAGACQINPDTTLQIWPSSNINISGAEVIDGHVAGVRIPCPQTIPPGGIGGGTGTSYSAAFTCALTTSTVSQRPWGSPAQVRQWMKASTVPMPGGLRLQTPSPPPPSLLYADWIHRYYPLPGAPLPVSDDDPFADPDSDGVPNFIEYYCGLDPRVDDAHYKPKLSVSSLNASVTLDVLLPRACWQAPSAQVKWQLERSRDLIAWSEAPLDSFAREPASWPCDGQPWRARATISPDAGTDYFRLNVIAVPPLL